MANEAHGTHITQPEPPLQTEVVSEIQSVTNYNTRCCSEGGSMSHLADMSSTRLNPDCSINLLASQEEARVTSSASKLSTLIPHWVISRSGKMEKWLSSSYENAASAESKGRNILQQLEVSSERDVECVLGIRRYLAILLGMQGKHLEAEYFQRQVVQDQLHLCGEDDPRFLASMSNLACILCKVRKYDEAEKLQTRVFEICMKKFGEHNHRSLACLHNLAFLYLSQGKEEGSIKTMSRVLAGRRALFSDPRHPQLLPSILTLAWIFQHQLRRAEALILYKEAYQILVQSMGTENAMVRRCDSLFLSLSRLMRN